MTRNWKKLKDFIRNADESLQAAIITMTLIIGALVAFPKVARLDKRDRLFDELNAAQQKIVLKLDNQHVPQDSIIKSLQILKDCKSTIEQTNRVLTRVYEYDLSNYGNKEKIRFTSTSLISDGSGHFLPAHGSSLWDDMITVKQDILNTKAKLARLIVALYDNSLLEHLESCESSLDKFIEEYSKE